MKTEQHYFEEAISMAEYMDQMTTPDLKEKSFNIYNSFQVNPEDELISLLKNVKPHILTITEDWCGDAMLNNPVFRKIAEEAGIEVRCVFRDADTDLIDRYLTNGGRAIPIYLFLNEQGEVISKWGPRAPQLQQLVMEMRSQLPEKGEPLFEEKQKEMYTFIQNKYVEDPQCAQWVYEDIKEKLTKDLL